MKKLYSVLIDTGNGRDLIDSSCREPSRLSVQEITKDNFAIKTLFLGKDGLASGAILLKRQTLFDLGEIINEIRTRSK